MGLQLCTSWRFGGVAVVLLFVTVCRIRVFQLHLDSLQDWPHAPKPVQPKRLPNRDDHESLRDVGTSRLPLSAKPCDTSSDTDTAVLQSTTSASGNQRVVGERLTLHAIEKHNTRADCWIVLHGKIYNVTEQYLDFGHPGGSEPILGFAGHDATEAFAAIHPPDAWNALESFYIGEVDLERTRSRLLGASKSLLATALTPDRGDCLPLTLSVRTRISPDSYKFRFNLASTQIKINLRAGMHLDLFLSLGGSFLSRAYTPIADGLGWIEFIIKVYRPTNIFPQGGLMSQGLYALNIGDLIFGRTSLGSIQYLGRGSWSLLGSRRDNVKEVTMVAGGTGIAPMCQILQAALADRLDDTKFALVFANRHESDILLHKELTELAETHRYRLRIRHCVSHPSSSWAGWRGHVSAWMLREAAWPPTSGSPRLALQCGPPAMERDASFPSLLQAGFAQQDIYSF